VFDVCLEAYPAETDARGDCCTLVMLSVSSSMNNGRSVAP
jgi:hypothetical protein